VHVCHHSVCWVRPRRPPPPPPQDGGAPPSPPPPRGSARCPPPPPRPPPPHVPKMGSTARPARRPVAALVALTTAAAAAAAVAAALLPAAAAAVAAAPASRCAPYTLCRADADCPPWRGARRTCALTGAACTSGSCALDPTTCAPTACTFDCQMDAGTCVLAPSPPPPPPPSPSPTCPPYQVCGTGRPPCGPRRRCRRRPCTASVCNWDPATCAPTVCTADCLRNAGVCVDAPTPTPTATPTCPPYQVCGAGKAPCGAGRKCRRQACTGSWCELDPVTCERTDACTEECQVRRGYCVKAD